MRFGKSCIVHLNRRDKPQMRSYVLQRCAQNPGSPSPPSGNGTVSVCRGCPAGLPGSLWRDEGQIVKHSHMHSLLRATNQLRLFTQSCNTRSPSQQLYQLYHRVYVTRASAWDTNSISNAKEKKNFKVMLV